MGHYARLSRGDPPRGTPDYVWHASDDHGRHFEFTAKLVEKAGRESLILDFFCRSVVVDILWSNLERMWNTNDINKSVHIKSLGLIMTATVLCEVNPRVQRVIK